MCGIFASVSGDFFDPTLILENLKKLEYRGYDSWGVVAVGKRTSAKNLAQANFVVQKQTGKIGAAKLNLKPTKLALGHTRWATHGGVTQANAHPHLSQDGLLAVVHNGIIENHQQLWDELQRNYPSNRTKKSETDSEVFAHLVAALKPKFGFVEAVRQAFLKLEGLSALVVADAESETLVAIKTGSPLVIGLGKDAQWVASDAHSLLAYTNKVIFLEDGQMAVITPNQVEVRTVMTGKVIVPVIEQLDWESVTSTQGEYPHFMLKEMNEQPKVLQTIATSFDHQTNQLARLLSRKRKLYLVGCGTAYHAALLSSYVLAEVAGIEATVLAGSEVSHKEQFMAEKSQVVFFSQSGETIDVIQPLKRLKAKDVTTIAIVNVFGSTLDRLADHRFLLEAGPEVCVLSTKAFLAMVALVMRAAHAIADQPAQAQQGLQAVAEVITELLQPTYARKYIDPLVARLQSAEHFFVIGRGQSYPIALEAALKVKEVTYLHTEGFAGGELKHGVIALIDQGTPCLVFAPKDEQYSGIISGATEIKARNGFIIGVAAEQNPVFDYYLPVADVPGFSGLAQVVVAQLVAYYLALAKGNDPDKPRNLAKSVTVV